MLGAAEPGFEVDTHQLKVGDGVLPWTTLPYIAGNGGGGGGPTDEEVRDLVATFLQAGANVTLIHNDAADTLTIASAGGGGGTDPEVVIDTIAAALVEGTNIDIVHNDAANTINIAVVGLTKSTVGLANVDNTSDVNKPVSTATQTALNAKADTATVTTSLATKADKATTVTATAPLNGSGTLGANLMLGIVDFTATARGAVPNPGGTTGRYLKDDATWATPAGGGGGGPSGHASFTFNATLTEPPATSQMRMNNANQLLATKVWVSQNDVDGLDVSIGLERILAGHQIYIQDYDDATKWIKYTVSAAVDDGAYYDFTVAYHSGPGGMPTGSGAAGRVEFQQVSPGTVGVPPGGATGQVLGKTGSADYAVGWVADQVGAGGGLDAEGVMDLLGTTGLVAGNNIDLTYSDAAGTLTVDVEALTIADVASLQATLDAKQPLDSDLTTIAGLTATTDNIIQSVGSAWASRTPAQVKTALAITQSDVSGLPAALTAKADDATTVTASAPLTGSGTLGANLTLGITDFSTTSRGAVPNPGSSTGRFLKDDGTWATPSGGAPVRRPLNAQTGTTYAPVVADENTMVTLSNAAAITVTLPSNATQAFPIGAEVDFLWLGVGQPTFVAGSGATVNATPGLKLRGRYSACTAKKIGTDAFVIIGDLAT